MLINDTLQLLASVILFLLVMCLVTFPTVYCVPLLLLSFHIHEHNFNPGHYVTGALCGIIYPLQRPAAWRSDRIWIIILSIWFLSFIFPMIEYSIGERDPAVDILSTPVLCKAIYINSSPIQRDGALDTAVWGGNQVRFLCPGNATSHTSLCDHQGVCSIPFFCVFLCCIVIMLRIFATNRHFLDNSRYILFAYMLINDTLQLLSSVILFLLVIGLVTFPTVYCVPLLLLSTSTFMNTTLILATMSLERYVAIIYPLQRPAAWRSDRIWIIILSIWFLSFIFPMIEYSIGERDPAVDILSTPVLCKPIYINSSPIQAFFYAKVSGLHTELYKGPATAMANPLVAFNLIKRLHSEWLNVVHSNEAQENTQALRSSYEKEEADRPKLEDLQGAAKGLMRLQDVYVLQVASLVRGLFQRVTEGQPIDIYRPAVSVPLSGDDCFLVGKLLCQSVRPAH
ncbi:hypothetical protein F7725_020555 [Dissostichus mawsoni]|uniref:G-protein coupled receptors family 1 profile domain-containing protein n=1 Tax=Dissostichus mawsoni TaxID=36200 RepID=A0A7J5YG71_DISMA|nr:hypothetical protein F7725_020555 [Dissostichus mawsoni]